MTETAANEKRARGRPKGSGKGMPAITTRVRNRALAQAEVKPLDVLLQTMAERWISAQAAVDPEERARLLDSACQVARDVAPYLHPKLQATTIKGDQDSPLSFTVSLPASDALRAMIRGTDSTK